MLKVGLTGSIAVGKSFVLSVFEELGCRVLDADRVAREVVAPGTVGLLEIVKSFGPAILAEDGSLDRTAMASLIFDDPEKREMLNSIIHPKVLLAQNEWLSEVERDSSKGISIVDAALMIESGGYKRFDKLIVVWCSPEKQTERLMARNGLSMIEAKKRIDAQMSQERKKEYADFLIDTSKTFEDVRIDCLRIFTKMRALV
jgi:dephospho-CoA kinase